MKKQKIVAKTVHAAVVGPIVANAAPFNQGSYWRVLSQAGTSNEESSESDSDSEMHAASGSTVAGQVTTIARFTYELDRYPKNALLMFVQMRSDPPAGSRVEETTTQDINVLLDTLSRFRFEENTHIDLTCIEIESKCQEYLKEAASSVIDNLFPAKPKDKYPKAYAIFMKWREEKHALSFSEIFQQDLTQYGAVVVAVFTFEGATGQLSALDGRFSESIILRHFTDDLNATLLAKPKIYVTEANRIISAESGGRLSIPLGEHQDVIGFHLPTIDHQAMVRRPVLHLCDNINEMADTHDFATILKKTVEEIERCTNHFPR